MQAHSSSPGQTADFADVNLRCNYALKWSEIQAAQQEQKEDDLVQEE